jgi:hypothetical protein
MTYDQRERVRLARLLGWRIETHLTARRVPTMAGIPPGGGDTPVDLPSLDELRAQTAERNATPPVQ